MFGHIQTQYLPKHNIVDLLASVSAVSGSKQADFQAYFYYLGHSGSLVSEESVDEHWVEDTGGVSLKMGVGYWGGARG